MTQEEKAKRYDEAISMAKKFYTLDSNKVNLKATLRMIFSELAESGDERIRKEVLDFIRHEGQHIDKLKWHKWIAWLEKQGEQKSFDYENADFAPKTALEEIKEEKVNNQNYVKPNDKVGPKFHEGDWITNGACIIQITSVDDRYYWHDNDCVGGDIESIDKEYHLWTIQDAKDGDVLVNQNEEMPFIFKSYNKNHVYCYCAYTNHKDRFFPKFVNDDGTDLHWINLLHEQVIPATKEQSGLLFQKMHEAGYEWDAEKKELKIIDWSKHIKCNPNNPSIIEESTWSEEDEERLQSCLNILQAKGIMGVTETVNTKWLKSLKQRIGE